MERYENMATGEVLTWGEMMCQMLDKYGPDILDWNPWWTEYKVIKKA